MAGVDFEDGRVRPGGDVLARVAELRVGSVTLRNLQY